MNFADVMKSWCVFKNSERVTRFDNFIAVIGVNVYPRYGQPLEIFILSEFYCPAQICSGVIYKIFVGVKENYPIAFSLTDSDVARRGEIILPSLMKNFRAEFFCNVNSIIT